MGMNEISQPAKFEPPKREKVKVAQLIGLTMTECHSGTVRHDCRHDCMYSTHCLHRMAAGSVAGRNERSRSGFKAANKPVLLKTSKAGLLYLLSSANANQSTFLYTFKQRVLNDLPRIRLLRLFGSSLPPLSRQ
jgi:hypothetical protein